MSIEACVDRYIHTMKDGKKFRIYKIPSQNNSINLYPSVTAICGNEGYDYAGWKKSNTNADAILLHAITVGTFGHFRIQSTLAKKWGVMSPPLELSPDQKKALNEWRDNFPHKSTETGIKLAVDKLLMTLDEWMFDYSPKHPYQIVNEQRVDANIYPFEIKIWSDKYGFAGSMDILSAVNVDGIIKNILIDIKTNLKKDYDHYKMQVIAYEIGLRENHPEIPIDDTRVLFIPKDNCNFRYKFENFDEEKTALKIEWFEKIKRFYEMYGDEEPLKLYRNKILKNVEEAIHDLKKGDK